MALTTTGETLAGSQVQGCGRRISEEEFHVFYDATARSLKSYLYRLVSNMALADDLMQEAYFRVLRSPNVATLDAPTRKSYLFRVATNLARDHYRSAGSRTQSLETAAEGSSPAPNVAQSADLDRLLSALPPRDRELLWLAYVEGASHREIAGMTGLKEGSIRPLLFRIRQKMATALRAAGFGPKDFA